MWVLGIVHQTQVGRLVTSRCQTLNPEDGFNDSDVSGRVSGAAKFLDDGLAAQMLDAGPACTSESDDPRAIMQLFKLKMALPSALHTHTCFLTPEARG